jgi:hypothetical protein
MQTDVNLLFTGASGTGQSIAGSANVASTGVYDIQEGLMVTGATYDNPFALGKFSPQSTQFGEDLGNGPMRLYGRAGVSATLPFVGPGATLNIAWQSAVDNLGGTIAGLTWTTVSETGPTLTAALLVANAMIPLPDLTRRALFATGTQGGMPRFVRLLYQVVGTFTQGTLTYAGLFPVAARDLDDQFYGGGFIVAP